MSACWLEFLDANNQFLWELLAGLDDSALHLRSRRAAHVRMAIDQRWSELTHVVRDVQTQLIRTLEASQRQSLRVAIQREMAIARHASHRHARIASALLQRGLFDRRGDREAVLQRDLLQQALAAGRERLDELNRRQTLSAGGVRLAFSLVAGRE